MPQSFHSVTPDVPVVTGVILGKSHGITHFGENFCQNVAMVLQYMRGTRTDQQFRHFRVNPLSADIFQQSLFFFHGCRGGRVNGKTKLCGKPKSPKNPQSIFLESLRRIAYSPNHTGFQIIFAPEKVDDGALSIGSHGIDGKIPASKIFPKTFYKFHPIRAAMVAVISVLAESGDFIGLFFQHHGDSAVLQSGFDDMITGKYLHGLLR